MALILIAEDEKGMQDILTDYMRHGGHTCITADDGIDAVTILKNNPVDLAVLDIMMPHLDGFFRMPDRQGNVQYPYYISHGKRQRDRQIKRL